MSGIEGAGAPVDAGATDESHGSFSNHSEEESPFFADMTLDLAEAHDIAETPEPSKKKKVTKQSLGGLPIMPNLPESPDNLPLGNSTSSATPNNTAGGYSDNYKDYDEEDGDAYSYEDEEDNPGMGDRTMTSISNAQASRAMTGTLATASSSQRLTPSARRWARDVPWAVGFCILVPFSLLFPMLFARRPASENPTENWLATAPAPRLATLHTLLWGSGAALVLSRLLYRTMGGGDGDDARHMASQLLLVSAPISVSVYISIIVAMYFLLPNALIYTIIPLWYLARDIFLFRSWKMTASTPGGQQAFFQALACMTLDILSRSLRRSSFYRMVSFLLVVQLVVIGWWRWALLAALQSHSWFWILLAAMGGKWATGTVARLLTLIASGGITSWFAEQESLVQEMGQRNGSNRDNDDEEMIEFTTLNNNESSGMPTNNGDDVDIPEAYRTVDASIYKPALDFDEGIDDDFEDEEEEGAALYPSPFVSNRNSVTSTRGSTVKQLFVSGISISFGSVAKCGLLGGLAQLIWSQLRKIDTARATFRNLQGMSIGENNEESMLNHYLLQANLLAREFVRNNSDMAMSHVAAFRKSYQRAAQDVATLIDEKGVEPLIHEDISTHMSSCVGGSISGVIVIFTGAVLVHQRNRNSPDVSDAAVLVDMIMAFIFCYTLIFTVMEPLRASIKAVYVSFAQHPEALSQAYPLIYHRLSRMSQSNLQ